MDQLQATKNELHETKQSLTELLDEVVYFEQQVNVATTRGDSIARVLSTSNASHVETVHCLISYAKALSKGFMDETSSSHATALRVLRDTSNDQSNAAAALADLNVTGCIPGWTLNGAEPLDLLRARILVPRENLVPVEAVPVRAPARAMPGSGDRRASLLPVATVIAKLVTTASQNPLQTPKMSAAVTSTT